MKRVTFKSVLDGVATRMGLEPNANLQLNQATALAEYITDRCAKYWERAAWPEWTQPELRQYRANWDELIDYAIGVEVYDSASNAYYRSIATPNQNNPPSDTVHWQPASELDTYIDLAQSWQPNVINRVWGVYADNPLKAKSPRKVSWWLGPQGVWVDTSLAQVYVDFSLPPPAFTTTEWDVSLAYVAGDLIYYPPFGDCYRALAPSTGDAQSPAALPANWSLQAFPAILSRCVKMAAIADALREDENLSKASAWDVQADDACVDALDAMGPAMRIQPNFSLGK